MIETTDSEIVLRDWLAFTKANSPLPKTLQKKFDALQLQYEKLIEAEGTLRKGAMVLRDHKPFGG